MKNNFRFINQILKSSINLFQYEANTLEISDI